MNIYHPLSRRLTVSVCAAVFPALVFATEDASFPPPPGPYQAMPPAISTPAVSPPESPASDMRTQMRQRHEKMFRQREEAMRKQRQEMIKRYQAMREQGFHPEREGSDTATTPPAVPAVPAWVEERRKEMQARREKYEAERQKMLKAQEEAQQQAQQQAQERAKAMAESSPAPQMPAWRPMPARPPYPRVPPYGYAPPAYPGMAWAPRPPMRAYPVVPNPPTRQGSGE